MKRRIVAMAVIICMITGFLYLQYGRDVKVTSSMNFSSGNYYEMELTLVANKLFIIDKQRFAEEMIERCIDNNFHDIKFSYDMMGYPNRLQINVYLNEFIGLFLITAIRKGVKSCFSYANGAIPERVLKKRVMLPAKDTGEPCIF